MIQRIASLALAAVLLCALALPALAEDFFMIDVDLLDMDSLNSDAYVQRELSASTQGVRVRKYISQSSELAAPVRLTLMQMDSHTLMFDKDYGLQSGTFDSGVIYLPYVDDRTIPYLVTLYVGDYVYAMPFMHLQPRLHHNSACTQGLRLRDLEPSLGSDWLMGTMVDISALRASGSQTVNVCASNSYVIGQATLSMSGDSLRVDLAFRSDAQVEVLEHSLYLITDPAAYAAGQRFNASPLGEWVDVSGSQSVLVYLPMQVSYNPGGLPTFHYSPSGSELRLWEEAVEPAAMPQQDFSWQNDSGWTDDSGWSDGWSDGWSNDSGWDDGWSGSGDGWM